MLKSLKFTTITMIGSLLAVFIAFVIASLKNKLDLSALTYRGEIIIICASLLINAIYIFFEYKDGEDRKWPTVGFWGTIFCYTMSIVVYVAISDFKPEDSPKRFISIFSLLILIATFIITWGAQFFQNINTEVTSMRNEDKKNLEDKFDKVIGRI